MPLARSNVRSVLERASCRSLFATVFVPVLVVYLVTATYGPPWHIDAVTNAVTAWSFGMNGSPVLDSHADAATPEQLGNVGWIVMSPRGPVSQYPPGTALLAAPLYAVWNDPMVAAELQGANRPELAPVSFPLPPLVPAAITAAVVTALAAAIVALMARSVTTDPVRAALAGYTTAFATGYWSVSSNQLWQHGPASAAVAAAVYATMLGHRLLGGLAFGAATLIRPHLAIIAAVVGVGLAVSERSLRPLIQIGATSSIGLASLLGFNYWVWGSLTISGGYGTYFTEAFVNNGLLWFVRNVVGALVDPVRGFLIVSPFFLLLLPGLKSAWKQADPTVRFASIGAVVYLLVQLRANRFSGGDGHFGYRYPLEPLTAAAPLLVLAFDGWTLRHARARRYFGFAVVLAAVPQLIWAVVK